MRQIEKKTIPEPNRTLILSFSPFFKFYLGNLYGIIIIILHPHLNTRFPWHFQSKRILRTYHRTFFISCILTISVLFFQLISLPFSQIYFCHFHFIHENLLSSPKFFSNYYPSFTIVFRILKWDLSFIILTRDSNSAILSQKFAIIQNLSNQFSK